ncbi:MAG: NAD(P)-binding protein [Myxococcota bacterium]
MTELPALTSDVIVVGSGFGGAVAACRFAQAGLSVLLLERGRRVEPQDFPPLPRHTSFAPSPEPFMGPGGVHEYRNLGNTQSLQANGYGGGSLIYAGVHLRPPDSAFAEWPSGRAVCAVPIYPSTST